MCRLEILLLIALTRKIGDIIEQKGRKSGWFKLLTVVLWIGGEVIGAVTAGVTAGLMEVDLGVVMGYLFALIGASLGALAAFVIAKNVSPLETEFASPPPPPTFT